MKILSYTIPQTVCTEGLSSGALMPLNSDQNAGLKTVEHIKHGHICESLISRWTISLTYFVLSPFSGGPRICVGMPFANAEMTYILARLFQVFTSLSTAQSELQYKMMILMVPSTEVFVNFVREKNEVSDSQAN